MNTDAKMSHCYPSNKERNITSTIAHCGFFKDDGELLDEPPENPCPICMEVWKIKQRLSVGAVELNLE